MRNAGLEEAQARIKIARWNINNLRYADDTTFVAGSEEELKRLFFILFDSKITADGNCSHEIKRCSFEEKPWLI